MKIALGADHAGFEEKEKLKKTLDELGVEYEDLGTSSLDSVDYPDFGAKVGRAVASGEVEQGIIVCGSGIGIAIAANKIRGVRAAQAWNEETARLARQHNDANVLSLGGRLVTETVATGIVEAFLTTPFEGGRHVARLEQLRGIEAEESAR